MVERVLHPAETKVVLSGPIKISEHNLKPKNAVEVSLLLDLRPEIIILSKGNQGIIITTSLLIQIEEEVLLQVRTIPDVIIDLVSIGDPTRTETPA
jgi:hypothetical protein